MKYKDANIFFLDFLFLCATTVFKGSHAGGLLQEQEATRHKPNPFLAGGTQSWPWSPGTPRGRLSVLDSFMDDLLPFNAEDIDRQTVPENSAIPTYPIGVVQWTDKKKLYPIQDSHANAARRKKLKVKANSEVKGRGPGWQEEHSSVPQLLVRLQSLAHGWGEIPPVPGQDAGLPNESSNSVNGYKSVNTIQHQEHKEYHFSEGVRDSKPKAAETQTTGESETAELKNQANNKRDNLEITSPCPDKSRNNNEQGKGKYRSFFQFVSVLGTGKRPPEKEEAKGDENEVPGGGAKLQKDSSHKWEHLQDHGRGETKETAKLDKHVSNVQTELNRDKSEKERTESKGVEEKYKPDRPVFQKTDIIKWLPTRQEMDKINEHVVQEYFSLKNKVPDKNGAYGHGSEVRTEDGHTQQLKNKEMKNKMAQEQGPQNKEVEIKIAQEQGDENGIPQGKLEVAGGQEKKLEDRHMDDSTDTPNGKDNLSKNDDENGSAEQKKTQEVAVTYSESDTRGYNETPLKSSNEDSEVSERLPNGPISKKMIIVKNSQREPELVLELQTQSPRPRKRRNPEGQTQRPTEEKNENGQWQTGKSTSSPVARHESTAKPNTGSRRLEAMKPTENVQSPSSQGGKAAEAGTAKSANGHRQAWMTTGGEGKLQQQKQAQMSEGGGLAGGSKGVLGGDMIDKTEAGSPSYDVADRAHPKRKNDTSPRVFLAFFIFFIVLFFIVTLVVRSVYNPSSGLSRANSRTALYQPNAMY